MTEGDNSVFFYEIVASRPCGARVEWNLNCSSLKVSASEINSVNSETCYS